MKKQNNMRMISLIPVACLMLILSACGNDDSVNATALPDTQVQEQTAEGTSGIVLEKSEKMTSENEEGNFESAHDYTNFEKRIMAISRLTEPED